MSHASPRDSSIPAESAHALASAGLWREGDLLVVERRQPLPPVCLLSGAPATHSVTCLFHRRRELLAGGPSPAIVFLNAITMYLFGVDKAKVAIPLASPLYRRWKTGWRLVALAVLTAAATIVGLLWGQGAIHRMPKGEWRSFLNDLGIPLLALGGFALIATLAVMATRLMPQLTSRLVPEAITPERIWLRGVCPQYLAALPARPDSRPDESEASTD